MENKQYQATSRRRSLAGLRSSWLWLVAGAALLGGCATPISPKDDALFQSYASTSDRPATRPVRSMSSFSDSLMCMDRMMREAEIPTTLITSKQIPDFSGRVPVATKDMVITALSQMSRVSNAFRFVDFEVDIARQDTVQNLTTILLNNNQMQLQRPALYVSGAISFVDQNVLSTRHGAGPFVSEDDELTRLLPDAANVNGDWQQGFRVGWLDLVMLRYACEIAGKLDLLAVTCLDRLAMLPALKVCNRYLCAPFTLDRIVPSPVAHDLDYQAQITQQLARCQPLFEPVADVDALLAMLGQELGLPVGIVSYGASASEKHWV